MPEHYSLDEFTRRRFAYKPGHHVLFSGPTQQAGKTTLCFALLRTVAGEDLPATVLTMKHTDRIVSAWTRRLGFRETASWPPRKKLGDYNHPPPGYTLWPKQTLSDPDRDNELLKKEFEKAIVDARKHPPRITVADEMYGLLAELKMKTP